MAPDYSQASIKEKTQRGATITMWWVQAFSKLTQKKEKEQKAHLGSEMSFRCLLRRERQSAFQVDLLAGRFPMGRDVKWEKRLWTVNGC